MVFFFVGEVVADEMELVARFFCLCLFFHEVNLFPFGVWYLFCGFYELPVFVCHRCVGCGSHCCVILVWVEFLADG